jgi:hypothetical protein
MKLGSQKAGTRHGLLPLHCRRLAAHSLPASEGRFYHPLDRRVTAMQSNQPRTLTPVNQPRLTSFANWLCACASSSSLSGLNCGDFASAK